jgi:predicted esterase
MSPEGPLPVAKTMGNAGSPQSLFVWIGDDPKADDGVLKDVAQSCLASSALVSLAWSQHPAGEAYADFNLKAPEVLDGSWYLRDRAGFENQDLDTLHDVELLGRSLVEVLEAKLKDFKSLDWKDVTIMGFGKGAGIAMYASSLNLFPKPVRSMILFSPVVLFPAYLAEKMQALAKAKPAQVMDMYIVWASKNRCTPGTYRQLLAQTLRKDRGVKVTPDTMPDGDHSFSSGCIPTLNSLLTLTLQAKR